MHGALYTNEHNEWLHTVSKQLARYLPPGFNVFNIPTIRSLTNLTQDNDRLLNDAQVHDFGYSFLTASLLAISTATVFKQTTQL